MLKKIIILFCLVLTSSFLNAEVVLNSDSNNPIGVNLNQPQAPGIQIPISQQSNQDEENFDYNVPKVKPFTTDDIKDGPLKNAGNGQVKFINDDSAPIEKASSTDTFHADGDKNYVTIDNFQGQQGKTIKEIEKEAEENDGPNYQAAGELQTCVDLTKRHMNGIWEKKGGNFNWKNYMAASTKVIKCLKDLPLDKSQTTQVNDSEDQRRFTEKEIENCSSKVINDAKKCDVAGYLIHKMGRSWSNPDQATATRAERSSQGTISCRNEGIQTLDYDACIKFKENYELMNAGQQIVYTGQAFNLENKNIDRIDSVKPGDATSGLKAQQDGLKDQQSMMNQRAAINTAKLTAMAGMYNNIPDFEDIKTHCSSYNNQQLFEEGNPKSFCEQFVASNGYNILINQQAKEGMKGELMKTAMQAGMDALMANLLGKRAKDVGNAIARVEGFKPIDPISTEAITTLCNANPNDPRCVNGNLERNFDMMGGNVISFGEGGTGTSFTPGSNNIDQNNPNSGAVGTARKGIATTGSVIKGASNPGGLASTVDAATVTKGGGSPAGGGGGGAGGGGVGGGGGGGLPSQGQAGGTQAAVQGKTPAYGGGSGSLSVMGGYGINKAKANTKDDGNPFAKLLGNKKPDNVMNFRTPASVGTQKDSLFDMISNRYNKVNADKRLNEYEQK